MRQIKLCVTFFNSICETSLVIMCTDECFDGVFLFLAFERVLCVVASAELLFKKRNQQFRQNIDHGNTG